MIHPVSVYHIWKEKKKNSLPRWAKFDQEKMKHATHTQIHDYWTQKKNPWLNNKLHFPSVTFIYSSFKEDGDKDNSDSNNNEEICASDKIGVGESNTTLI